MHHRQISGESDMTLMNTTAISNNEVTRLELEEFKHKLNQQILTIFSDQKSEIPQKMMSCVYSEATQFFDHQMQSNMPSFINTLIYNYPDFLTTYKPLDELTVDPDGETSIYDLMHDCFCEIILNDSIQLGVQQGVFAEHEDSIDLTPFGADFIFH